MQERPPRVRDIAPDVPAELAAIADRALMHDLGSRHPGAVELAQEIEAWQEGRPVRAYDPSPWELARRFARRNRAAAALVAATLAAVALAGAFVYRSLRVEQDARERAERRARQTSEERDRAVASERHAQAALARALLERAERALADGDSAAAAMSAAGALARDPAHPRSRSHTTLVRDEAGAWAASERAAGSSALDVPRRRRRAALGVRATHPGAGSERRGQPRWDSRGASGRRRGRADRPRLGRAAAGAGYRRRSRDGDDRSRSRRRGLRRGGSLGSRKAAAPLRDRGDRHRQRRRGRGRAPGSRHRPRRNRARRSGHCKRDRALAGGAGALAALAWSQDAGRLASFGPSTTRLEPWEVPHVADAVPRTVSLGSGARAAAVSPDGARIAVAIEPAELRIVELATLAERTFPALGPVHALGWSAADELVSLEGRQVVVRRGDAEVVDILHPPDLPPARMAVTRDRIVVLPRGSPERPVVASVYRRLPARAARDRHALREVGRALAWDARRERLVVATASSDRTVRLWDVESGREIRVLPGHDEIAAHAACSPDGTRIATVDGRGTVRVFEIETGRLLHAARPHDGTIERLAWSANGRWLVAAGFDVRVIDAATLGLVRIVRTSGEARAAFDASGGEIFAMHGRFVVRVRADPETDASDPERLLRQAERRAGARLEGVELVVD